MRKIRKEGMDLAAKDSASKPKYEFCELAYGFARTPWQLLYHRQPLNTLKEVSHVLNSGLKKGPKAGWSRRLRHASAS